MLDGINFHPAAFMSTHQNIKLQPVLSLDTMQTPQNLALPSFKAYKHITFSFGLQSWLVEGFSDSLSDHIHVIRLDIFLRREMRRYRDGWACEPFVDLVTSYCIT